MNIRAGIIGRSLFWEQTLRREGIPWTSVDPVGGEGMDACSVVVVPDRLSAGVQAGLADYLRGGGALLAAAAHVGRLAGTTVRKQDLSSIVADNDRVFPSLRLMDLDAQGSIPREANHLRTPENTSAVFAGSLGGGAAVLLPFDPAAVFANTRTRTRAFYARHDRLPTERVSGVSRGEIFQLIHHALEFLHHCRSLPYVHCWYYPGTRKNVLSFRIDTDGAPRHDIDALYSMLNTSGVPATWFLDVAAHESWLGHFAAFEGHEIGLHCYRHRIHADLTEQEADWQRGLSLLRGAGFSPEGMAAPFGTWTPELALVIDRLGLTYSSEFAYAYDTLPVTPEAGGMMMQTLQMPIHPVSTGSLRRAGFTPAQMRSYYRATADALLSRDLPLAFYHHPTHRNLDVFAVLFDHCRARGIEPLRMESMARWWNGRALLTPSFRVEGKRAAIEGSAEMRSAEVGLRIAFPSGEEAIVEPAPELDLDAVRRVQRQAPVVPEDIRAIRAFDPRRAIGDLFVALQRRMT